MKSVTIERGIVSRGGPKDCWFHVHMTNGVIKRFPRMEFCFLADYSVDQHNAPDVDVYISDGEPILVRLATSDPRATTLPRGIATYKISRPHPPPGG